MGIVIAVIVALYLLKQGRWKEKQAASEYTLMIDMRN